MHLFFYDKSTDLQYISNIRQYNVWMVSEQSYFEVSAAFYFYTVENKLEHISRYKVSIE